MSLRSEGPMAPRPMGAVNWYGLWTLYAKEVRRFTKVFTQTVMAPVVTSLLFLAIFTLALGHDAMVVEGVPYTQFLAPGLVMAAIVQNAFANTTSSLLISKIQGNIVDVLMPPLSPSELFLGFALGGLTRGVLVALATGLSMALFVEVDVAHPWAVLYFGLSASLMLSLLGVAVGIWAEKFDHIAAITNFVVMPLAFLSGSFYSIERLPGLWYDAAHANPFFYMIDGFRYGFIGHAEGSLAAGIAVTAGLNLALCLLCHRLFASGYKLKS